MLFCALVASIPVLWAQSEGHGKTEVENDHSAKFVEGESATQIVARAISTVNKEREHLRQIINDPKASPEQKQRSSEILAGMERIPSSALGISPTSPEGQIILQFYAVANKQVVDLENNRVEAKQQKTSFLVGTRETTVETVQIDERGARALAAAVGTGSDSSLTPIVTYENQPAVVASLAAFSQTRAPVSQGSADGIVSSNLDKNFDKTLGRVRAASSSSGGAGGGGSFSASDMRDVGYFVDRARDTLGVPREGFDLSSNPFYSPAAGAEIRSVFKDFAMGSGLDAEPNYLDERGKLNKLVTTPGFQDSRISPGTHWAKTEQMI
jgi:hypothetical protein